MPAPLPERSSLPVRLRPMMAAASPSDAGTRPRAIVVGGGPGGLMAAERLAGAGLEVVVYEHMPSMGRKLLLAGRGGLNITHSEPLERLLARYTPLPSPLEAALRAFGPDDLRAWCAELGEPTFVGSSGRVFPQSFRATPLLRAWLARLAEHGVEFRVRHRWLGWADGEPEAARATDPGGDDTDVVGPMSGGGWAAGERADRVARRRSRFGAPDGSVVVDDADVTVFALGGASWPRVGSTGTWVEEFARQGIEVRPLRAANVGVRVEWTSVFVRRFAGAPLKNIAIGVAGSDAYGRGDAMVTDTGLEGGPVYAVGVAIREALDAGACILTLDLQPDRRTADLGRRLASLRRPKDSISTWLRRAGIDAVAVGLARDVTGNRLPADADGMAALLKAVPVPIEEMMPIDRAISTAGGVAFDEVDESFMLRRLPGVFVVGEMLDWEAPTGGYLLQATFSTAVCAAEGALAWLRS